MVIDKKTGRGCALAIVSKKLTMDLVADGIVGKSLCRTANKDSVTLLRVVCRRNGKYGKYYVEKRREEKDHKEPIWTPSFIDRDIWDSAVSRFQNLKRLDINIEKYLLPNMGEYLCSISDSVLISLTRQFLLMHGVINKPIRQRSGKTYYFNEHEIYSIDNGEKLFAYERRIKCNIFTVLNETCFNMNVWAKAAAQFEVGMTLIECIEIFLQTELVFDATQRLDPIDKLVQHIASPIYERAPENSNTNTFDRIRITVGLPRYSFSWDRLQSEVKIYRNEIYKRVIQKLENDRQFKKYNVPMGFLKIASVTLLRDFSIEFIFELKPEIQN